MLKLIISGTFLTIAITTQTILSTVASSQPEVVSAKTDQTVQTTQVSSEIKEALKKFTALNSRLKVGMNFPRYLDEVAELNVTLDEVSDEARKNPAYSSLNLALEDYKIALSVWQNYIKGSGSHNFFSASAPYGSLLIENYKVATTDINGSSFIYLNDALSSVWEQAGKKISEAKAN